jgi:carboxylesterase type B
MLGQCPDIAAVTVFGESAGAMSIDALLTSYGRDERPPFRAAILQSGQLSYRGVSERRNEETSSLTQFIDSTQSGKASCGMAKTGQGVEMSWQQDSDMHA